MRIFFTGRFFVVASIKVPCEEDGDDDLDGDHGDGEHGDLLLGNLPLDQLEARHA